MCWSHLLADHNGCSNWQHRHGMVASDGVGEDGGGEEGGDGGNGVGVEDDKDHAFVTR